MPSSKTRPIWLLIPAILVAGLIPLSMALADDDTAIATASTALANPMTQAPQEAPPPISEALLKRLAAAARGAAGAGPVWVVLGAEFPHPMSGGYFGEESEAEAHARELGEPYQAYGPLEESFSLAQEGDQAIFLTCKTPWSDWDCDRIFMPGSAVDSIRVEVVDTDGFVYERSFSPDAIDAVFFNMRAYDRFAVPYNVGVFGVEHALQQRDSIIAAFDQEGFIRRDR